MKAALLSLLVVGASALAAPAQERMAARGGRAERPAVVRWTAEREVRLDGVPDEPVWSTADSITDFRQREPSEGSPASERTVVRFLATPAGLYVGFTGHDRHPRDIRAAQLRRDADFESDDSFTLLLDPQRDRRSGYVFGVNPNGALYDAEIVGVDQTDSAWNGIWDARARRSARGWTAELFLPWSTLRYPAGGTTWGLNVERFLRRANEEVLWRGWRRSEGLLFQEAQGELTGLDSLPPRGPELRPYAAVFRPDDQSPSSADAGGGLEDPAERELKIGGDAELALGRSLTVDLTANTDFAQVEVDEQVVNLTRFPLFFPEKRPFFLEGAGIFDFGDIEETQLFYSRRIGLDDEGATVPILAGARLHGRTGAYRVGALAVRSGGAEDALDLVARARRDVLSRGFVGGMVTSQTLPGAGTRWTAGGDVELPFILGDENLLVYGYGGGTGGGGGPTGAAWGLNFEGLNDWAEYHIGAGTVGRDFEPALGFVQATGVRRFVGGFDVFPRPPIPGVRQLNVKPFSWDVLSGLDGDVANAQYEIRPLGVHFESGDVVELNLKRIDDEFPEEFEVFPGSVVAPGSYRDTRGEIRFSGSRGRNLSVDLGANVGEFYDGRSTELDAAVELRVAPHVISALHYATELVRRPDGGFTARTAGLRLDLAATPRLGGTLFAQWENESDRLTMNARLHWSPRPGTDVYVVWNHGWDTSPADVFRDRSGSGALIGKIVHAFTP